MVRTRKNGLTVLLVAVLFACLAALSFFVPTKGISAADGTEGSPSDAVMTAEDLQSAISAAGIDDTVTLTGNVNGNITVGADADVIIDLKGFEMTSSTQGMPTVKNEGKLKIVDSSADKTGVITRENTATYYVVVNEGDLTLDGVTVRNDNAADTSSLLENNFDCAEENAATLTIESGTYYCAGGNVVKNENYGTLNINGGDFTSAAIDRGGSFSVLLVVGTANITNGTFTSTADGDGVRVVGTNGSTAALDITGGTFTVAASGAKALLLQNGDVDLDKGTLDVNIGGGTFNGDIGVVAQGFAVTATDEIAITNGTFNGSVIPGITIKSEITGGIFSEIVDAAYYPADFVLCVNDEGKYTVARPDSIPSGWSQAIVTVEMGMGSASIQKGFATIQQAIDSASQLANEGIDPSIVKITLHDDVKENIVVPKLEWTSEKGTTYVRTVRLYLNGCTLTGADNSPVITNNGTFYLYAERKVNVGGNVLRSTDSVGVVIKNNGTMTLYNNGISVKNLNTADVSYLIENNSKLTFSSSTYDGGVNTYAAAGGNLILNNEAATVTINKGNLNGSIYNNGGTVSIKGGTYSEIPDYKYFANGYVWTKNDSGTFDAVKSENGFVAVIGNIGYTSLADAVWSTDTGDVKATVITLVGEGDVISGPGVQINGQNVIIDLNGKTYNVINPTVGSPGTETNAFQMLKGSTVVFRNGALTSGVAKILLQNYCDLTLEDVTINATGSSSIQYIASNNNGSFTAVGNTQLIADEGQVAFDVYYGMSANYDDGVTVTFGEDFTGKVVGKVEYSAASRVTDGTWQDKAVVTIENGEFDIAINLVDNESATDANINISGGNFTQAFDGAYLASDAVLYPTADGVFAVADQATAEQETIGVAQIGQVIYKTLAEAVAAARDGDEIDLLTNISAPGAINITNDITLDFNGHAIDSDRTIAIVIDGANANIISTGARGTLNTPANGISVINGSNVEISDIDIYTEIYILKKDDGSQQVYDGRAIQIVGSTAVIDNVVTSLTADNADYTVAHWYIGDSDVTITNSCVMLVYTRSAASAENGSLQGYAVYSDNSDVTIENSSISSTGDETAYGVIFFGNMAIDDAAANGEGFKTLSLTDTAVIADAFAVSGNGTPNDCSGTDIVITGDCKIKSNYAQAIYHPQYGVLTINLTEDSALAYIRGVSGIEMRAGELVVIGGYIEATGDELDSMPNGNGSTTSGAAIAIVQHTTKQPINVRLDGGVFNGVFAVYEENQQNNEQAAVEKISLAINGGVFNGSIGSENLVDFVNGGKFAVMPEETYFADNYTGELYDGYYVVIEAVTEDNVALIEAQLAAQADARNYLAALGLTLADLETSAESGAADIVVLYDAIADATSVSGAQLAKLRLMDAADEFVAALAAELDAYKAEKIAALETLAGDGYVPAYAIAAINGAASVAEVDACYNAAVAEINAADNGDDISLTGVYVMLGVILVVAVAALMILLLKKQKQAEAAEAKAAAPLDRELAEVKQAVEADETAAAVSAAAEDDDKEQIVIEANVRTFDEAYGELDEEQKKLFNDVKDYALTKEGAALTELSSGVCVKKGSKQIVKLTVRRGNPVALFVIENEMIKDFRRNSDAPVKLKVKATELVLREDSDLEAAKAMVDVAVDQIEKDILAAKERRREARRLRRQRKREQKRQ